LSLRCATTGRQMAARAQILSNPVFDKIRRVIARLEGQKVSAQPLSNVCHPSSVPSDFKSPSAQQKMI